MGGSRLATRLALLAIVLGALALRVFPLLTPNLSVGSVEYDAGVYYAAAALAIDGAAPYRDVVFLHPPGIVLLLEPFALLGTLVGDRTAFLLARLLVVVVATVDLLLVAWLASRWRGPWAGVVAAFVYATSVAVLYSESTLLLEPFLTLGGLGAILLVVPPIARPIPRAAVVTAGVLLAAALAIKLWMVVPIGLIGLRLVVRRDLRAVGWLVATVGVVSAVLWLPSFMVDPAAAVQQVFLVQASRPADGVSGVADRLLAILGFGPFGAQAFGGALGGWLGIAVIVVAGGWALIRGGGEGRWWTAVLLATTTFFLVSPAYYRHYGAFAAPALAILLGGALVAGLDRVTSLGRRPAVAVVGLGLAVVVLLSVARAVRLQSEVVGPGDDYGRAIASLVPDSACIATDGPTWLVLADRRPRPQRGDEPMADVFGAQHVAALGSGIDRFATSEDLLRSPASQAVLEAYLRSCPYVLVSETADAWPPATRTMLERDYVLAADWSADGGPRLWARR